MAGWIKLHRELMTKAIWKTSNPVQKVVLITLLMMANHDEKEWEWNGEKYHCKPGEFITSLKSIKEVCGDGVSIQNIRTAIQRFEKYEFLTSESTNRNRKITIENWDVYQREEVRPNKETNKRLTSNQQATNKQLTTNKNDKNDKNDKNLLHQDFIDRYNETCPSLPRLEEMTPHRVHTINHLIKKYGIEKVEDAFSKAERSDFLTGRNGKLKYPKTFDWFIHPENFLKILEGNYDNKKCTGQEIVTESEEELRSLFINRRKP